MKVSSDNADTLRDHARDLADQTQDAVAARSRAHVNQAKSDAADHVEQAANAAQAAAAEFDPSTVQAQALQQVADAVEGVAHQLRHADIGQMANGVKTFARQNPALLVGGAALAGLALARFFKARTPHETAGYDNDENPWHQPSSRDVRSHGGFNG